MQNNNKYFFSVLRKDLILNVFFFYIGARQNLFKKKWTVIVTLSDVFKTLQQKSTVTSSYLQQTGINSRDARVFYIGFSYTFGTTNTKKPAAEKIQYDNNL